MSLIDSVSECTRLDFNKIFDMSVMECFSYALYVKMKTEKEQKAIEDYRMKNKGKIVM